MSKKRNNSRSNKAKSQKAKELTPVTVFVCVALLGMIGYLVGEVAFDSFPHPVHWSGLVVGILIGALLGKWVYKRYGDIFGI